MIYVLDQAERNVLNKTHCELDGISFLLTISSTHTGFPDRAAVVSCAYELQHYLIVATDVIIKSVKMLCPPALTRSGQWTLEDLERITCFQSVESQHSAVVYRTSHSVYKIGELDLRRKKISRVWFSEKNLERHQPRISETARELTDHQMYAPLHLKPASSIANE